MKYLNYKTSNHFKINTQFKIINFLLDKTNY